MRTLRTVAEVRAHVDALRAACTIGLVPTMGALHEGHVALFRAARRRSEHTIATIFVNPRQFDDPADLAAYPREEARDFELAAAASVDTVFVPDVQEIYSADDATSVVVEGAALGYEGTFRPGHFNGVATVCLKLFNIVEPQFAFFGQKDAQQVAVIRQLVRDLRLNLRVEVVPTVRERDGLALSSRNVRLSPAERVRALAIPEALQAGLAAYQEGRDPAATARDELRGLEVDYVEVARFDGRPTLVIAARVGRTRLIDNVPLDDPAMAGFGVAAHNRLRHGYGGPPEL
jgi:pantoate--beta-alanine ligase